MISRRVFVIWYCDMKSKCRENRIGWPTMPVPGTPKTPAFETRKDAESALYAMGITNDKESYSVKEFVEATPRKAKK